jgi:glutamate dehydrogenase/leucine dehydrogenase
VLAALEIQITAGNVGHPEASMNYGVCNWPTSLEADAMSESTGTIVVPDILANVKGVTDQNFDWMQNDPRRYRALERVSKQIGATTKAESRPPIGIPEQQSISLRTAEVGPRAIAHGKQ